MALDSALEPWVRRLLADFELAGTDIDINEILDLAGDAAHGIVRPAAPLTTYIAGYAAGLAVGAGQAPAAQAMEAAAAHVRSVLAAYLEDQGTEST
ncbi:DUF6457 domain-containing protein [Paeniglutamicibacter cryotolerans]|uniref:DUF6457 domain-containing protein n=1 Tax=Paeniglutamicibacter cryotolerans TaxID=670079 RepID=A0A839QTR4_9MICC|nr:DUF6457 domain-containing protein [Paeniglutamicibacter cryotolerans]MBB2995421.1 hypothetical protein [Paeniglutamicibacter cryotolerans]